MTTITRIVSLAILPAAVGCTRQTPGPWYAAPAADSATLSSQHGVIVDGEDVLRRDVSVSVLIFPATGYPEWGIRREDDFVEIIAPATSAERQRKEREASADSSDSKPAR